MEISLNTIDVAVLCGGLGTRLRPAIGQKQKTMANLDGRPFLDVILEYLSKQGFKRVILCAGYQAQEVQEYYAQPKFGLTIEFSKEAKPLGTGGAVRNARDILRTDPFIVLNGDSYCPIDYSAFINFHLSKKALLTMVLGQASSRDDYGSVLLDHSYKVRGFKEKINSMAAFGSFVALVNAGIYCFSQEIFSFLPSFERFSLETDFFPELIGKNFFGFSTQEKFMDIGTIKRYEEAQIFLRKDG